MKSFSCLALVAIVVALSTPAEARRSHHRHHVRCPAGTILRVSLGSCERKPRAQAAERRHRHRLKREALREVDDEQPPPSPAPKAVACPQPKRWRQDWAEAPLELPIYDLPDSRVLHPSDGRRFDHL